MNSDFLYLKLANHISRQIEKRVFRPGDKLPSVRGLAKQRGIGINTVLTAYAFLQENGLIVPVERSGFIVAPVVPRLDRPSSPLEKPLLGNEANIPLTKEVIIRNRDPKLTSLAGASLSASLLPIKDLRRHQLFIDRNQFDKTMQYEPFGGTHELKVEILRRLLLQGVDLLPEDCLITGGGTQSLQIAARSIINPGDLVAVESPCYFGFHWMLEAMGAKVLELPTDPRTGISVDALEKVMSKNRIKAAVLHPNFQNPLGSIIPDDAKERIASLSAYYNVPIIEADTTGDLFFGERRPKPIRAFAKPKNDTILSYGTFSKLVSPGFRVGYLLPGQYRSQAEIQLRALSMATSTSPQLVLARFLRSGDYDRHLRKLRVRFQQHMLKFITQIEAAFPSGTRVTNPTGGYLLWVELPKNIDSEKLWRRAIAKGVSITPGKIFSQTNRHSSFLRISCGVDWTNKTEKAINLLGELAHKS